MNDTAIAFKQVIKTYGATQALNVQCEKQVEIKWGQVTAILGQSGSGKSTLLNILSTLEKTDKSDAKLYLNEDSFIYDELSEEQSRRLRKEVFSVAFQDGHLIDHVDLIENITLPKALKGEKVISSSLSKELIALMKLDKRLKAKPKELSGGEYQRGAIARSIASDSNIIFADEPTGNLDTDLSMQVMDVLKSWAKSQEDRSLVFVTHDVHQASVYADNFIVMKDGRVHRNFTKAQLKEEAEAHGVNVMDYLLELTNPKLEGSQERSFDSSNSEAKATLAYKIKYLFRYSWLDLFPFVRLGDFKYIFRDAIFPVLSMFAISMLFVILLVGFGMFTGVTQTLNKSMNETVRSNRIVGNFNFEAIQDTHSFSDEYLSGLAARLDGEFTERNWFLDNQGKDHTVDNGQKLVNGIDAFTDAQLFVNVKDNTYGLIGHTISPNSPLWEKLTVNEVPLEGPLFATTEAEGIILSKRFLKNFIGLDKEQPDRISILYGTKTEYLDVLAYIDELPDGDFLLSSGVWHQIRDQRWRPYFGAMKIEGASFDDEEITKIQKVLGRVSNNGRVVPEASGNAIIYSGLSDGWSRNYWIDSLVDTLSHVLERDLTELNLVLELPVYGKAVPADLDFGMVAFYLSNISSIEALDRILNEEFPEVKLDQYVVSAYKTHSSTLKFTIFILMLMTIGALVFSLLNIIFMFSQSVIRKRHQIGILKAFGNSSGKISSIYMLQAFYLTTISFSVGILLASFIGQKLSLTLINVLDINTRVESLFRVDFVSFWGIFLGILSLNILITFLVTRSYCVKSANLLLREK